VKYTILNGSQPDLKVEADSVPRIGEIINIGSNSFTVTEVMHSVEPGDGFNRGTPFVETSVLISVLCD